MSVALVCNGSVTLTTEGAPLCSTGWMTVDYSTVVPFDPSLLDPATLGAAFGAGFFLSVLPIATAFGFKSLLSILNIRI
jgi:hypothetical protein